jgi:hypothetical protein
MPSSSGEVEQQITPAGIRPQSRHHELFEVCIIDGNGSR